jgi:hypothetical protein
MVKFSVSLLLLAACPAQSFVLQTRTFARPASGLCMSDPVVDVVVKKEVKAKAPPAAPKSSGGALVPIKEETVQFTAGLVGGIVGLAIGGPALAAIGAALTNYASKSENEVGEVVSAVSKSSIEVYNYLAKLDDKYALLTKAQSSLEDALVKIKSNDSVEPETVKKVEDALANTSNKIKEVNDEYDLVGAGVTALGVVGDLVEKAIKKVGELNEEYQLTGKALDAVNKAVDKAKST